MAQAKRIKLLSSLTVPSIEWSASGQRRSFSSTITGGGDALQEKILSLCKRRGFVFQGSNIYGGMRNSYDYGPLGAQMKKNIMDAWWQDFIEHRLDCLALDSSIMLHPEVWKASGHVDKFVDPMTSCTTCKLDDLVAKNGLKCPSCGNASLTESKMFNLLFETKMGATASEKESSVYLRPETAQGAFINFDLVATASRKKLPFGIGQMGKSFRNEISPGNFLFRTVEFEQMELQYFCDFAEREKWYAYWVDYCFDWLVKLGIPSEDLRKHQHKTEELAHYAHATTDIEFRFPFGWSELWGIADRGDYDLRKHSEATGQDLAYKDNMDQKKSMYPCAIEPAVGANRLLYAFLVSAYHSEEVEGRERVVLRLHPQIAPYQLAVLPLLKKPEFVQVATELSHKLVKGRRVDFDVTGSIGRRYRRQDEIGTPLCVTVDHETLTDGTVTVRARDSLKQIRVHNDELVTTDIYSLFERLNTIDT